ncbi:hypothetical protein F2Q69_00004170 [Brassica cretica]|uniref:Embryo sac development arrest 6 n=1 Tax=Brassica cretica TaxID=69181 RepID=A0A8S9PC44_BRACR|nr:hypothetical protein F2Q69_00004170 [Brassica cretica]
MSQNHHAHTVQTTGASRKRKDTTESATSNWVLAGYMAHEFLTCGTMLGRKLYPAWAEVGPLDTPSPQQHREVKKKTHQSYSEVSSVFKTDGIHIPGVVNPTQLAKWIQM